MAYRGISPSKDVCLGDREKMGRWKGPLVAGEKVRIGLCGMGAGPDCICQVGGLRGDDLESLQRALWAAETPGK